MENHPGRNRKRNSEKFVITFKDRYFGSATLRIMSLSIMIHSATTFRISTISIMTFSTKG